MLVLLPWFLFCPVSLFPWFYVGPGSVLSKLFPTWPPALCFLFACLLLLFVLVWFGFGFGFSVANM